METPEALNEIKKSCANLSAELMRLNPAIGKLQSQEIKDDLFKAIYQLTKDVETVKKLVRKAETSETTPLT